MKRFIPFLFLALPAMAQQQSLSQPAMVPIICSGQATTCTYPVIAPGNTGVIVALRSSGINITDTYGDIWTRNFCVQFDGDCIFSTHFNVQYPSGNDVVTFSYNPSGSQTIIMLKYAGLWNFVLGQQGTYAAGSAGGNAPFPDCPAGDCPYNWTLPVAADPGDLLVSWSNSNATGPMLAEPGLGFDVEASTGFLAVEDMVVPKEGPYIGALTWRLTNGLGTGGSHWLMGLAQFRRA